ncbi:quinoprotein glucose dehydrogenase [Altererythrobacter atlanticus]|uniref:Quinate/shikimate dehydrogenase (Quinone) n=1 Tax=Croceibacterium atlanticum TaxID=1267766 RepID=A0A0F7KNW8_9SPHN|nr:PQQ-binding-like beta-propeller repeat protein [Croceibacterium atlanticum]AKH42203.1 Quinate/shikimate dehydrogenase (quinone) [Croceibacterium atlanticum]MBB5733985.1 quinoprotein glucose dehydrogenase [Croceibacterium atlanticum]
MRFARSLGLATSAALIVGGTAFAQVADGDWQTINRDAASTRYSPLADINRANVNQLQEAWSYPLRGFNTATPLVVGGTMYMPAGSRVVALDADSGEEIWSYAVPPSEGEGPPRTASTRGVSYWADDNGEGARILFMAGNLLIALDARTGQPVSGFGDGGMVDVGVPYGGTPSIGGTVAVIGAATLENPQGVPGNPRAFDVRTGEKLWEFQTVPQEGEPHNESWGNGWKNRSGTNMWSVSAPIDLERGIVILPISSPAPNYWGGGRPGDNLYGNSLVAVDLKTGEYKWHFQTVHHDIWDTDIPSAGPLIDATIDGKKEPVIAHVGKAARFFVLDRETGEPALPVEERPVPQGDVPGEYYAPTQPFPVKTPPLARVKLTYDDLVTAEDTSEAHAQACQAMWRKAGGYLNYGPFTPFYLHRKGAPPRSTIQLPGGTGGVNWGGMAVDPNSGMVFANIQHTSLVGWVELKETDESYSFDANDTNQPYDRASVDGKGPFFTFSAPLSGEYDEQGRPVGPSLPCYKPPWAELTAVDANTGDVKWQVPLGLFEQLPEGRQVLGNAGNAGPTVTAGGLVFVGATNDKRFRAFDAETGRQLWEAQLRGNANANPMTYRGSDGKQYVAINAGGTIMAYSLSR